MAISDLSRPCDVCAQGEHDKCKGGLCGCIADHYDDDNIMRGFKILKRKVNPELESRVKGGWQHRNSHTTNDGTE